MEIQITLQENEVTFDNLGRVIITNNNLRNQITNLIDQSELAACNTCTNTCGNTVNACGNTANGSCSSSFFNTNEIFIENDQIIFKNPEFNSSILNKKLKNEVINIEFKGFNS
ncbi:hypothetical protein [uncultured Tenacibaculum sp.]|uniref:hypothetical protein n=1 Tax=uncultured Tenacibaculum sp. TaxID=174713 RepID=UPI0026336C3D|nr:hypothetical protein [uncultured Tenacibaculum sp.]